MEKEKQIEEMAKDMCEYYYEGTCYQDKKPCDCKCDIFTDAQYLYAKDYRKASEVAREIFEGIDSCIWSETHYGDSKLCFEINSAKYTELKKEYTE